MQPKINLQSFKSTPDSLKQHLTALERKRSLGAPAGTKQGKRQAKVSLLQIDVKMTSLYLSVAARDKALNSLPHEIADHCEQALTFQI